MGSSRRRASAHRWRGINASRTNERLNRASPATPALPEAKDQTDDQERHYHVVGVPGASQAANAASLDDVGRPELSDPRNAELARRPGLQTHHEQSRATGRRAKRRRGRGDQARGETQRCRSPSRSGLRLRRGCQKTQATPLLARKPSISLTTLFAFDRRRRRRSYGDNSLF